MADLLAQPANLARHCRVEHERLHLPMLRFHCRALEGLLRLARLALLDCDPQHKRGFPPPPLRELVLEPTLRGAQRLKVSGHGSITAYLEAAHAQGVFSLRGGPGGMDHL